MGVLLSIAGKIFHMLAERILEPGWVDLLSFSLAAFFQYEKEL